MEPDAAEPSGDHQRYGRSLFMQGLKHHRSKTACSQMGVRAQRCTRQVRSASPFKVPIFGSNYQNLPPGH
jgi:hypothetical protein